MTQTELDAMKLALSVIEGVANTMTVGFRYTNEGQSVLDALPILREAVEKATAFDDKLIHGDKKIDLENFTPVKCKCGTHAQGPEWDSRARGYIVKCANHDCPAISQAKTEANAVEAWNRTATKL